MMIKAGAFLIAIFFLVLMDNLSERTLPNTRSILAEVDSDMQWLK